MRKRCNFAIAKSSASRSSSSSVATHSATISSNVPPRPFFASVAGNYPSCPQPDPHIEGLERLSWGKMPFSITWPRGRLCASRDRNRFDSRRSLSGCTVAHLRLEPLAERTYTSIGEIAIAPAPSERGVAMKLYIADTTFAHSKLPDTTVGSLLDRSPACVK